MKSIEETLARRDALQEVAVADAHKLVADTLDDVIREATFDITQIDSPEYREFVHNSAQVALRMSYIEVLLLSGDPFFDLMDKDHRFERTVRVLTELRALADDLCEALLEIAVGTGVLRSVVRQTDGSIDLDASTDEIEHGPFELAQLVIDRVQPVSA